MSCTLILSKFKSCRPVRLDRTAGGCGTQQCVMVSAFKPLIHSSPAPKASSKLPVGCPSLSQVDSLRLVTCASWLAAGQHSGLSWHPTISSSAMASWQLACMDAIAAASAPSPSARPCSEMANCLALLVAWRMDMHGASEVCKAS